jgi:Phage-related minor tail protein
MSQITNVVTTEFRGRAGQAIATMGQVGRSFQNLDRNISNTTRMSERLNNQWKAIGTTIRYAIAGQAVFGMTRMVGQLREMQQQMGLITAIGTVQRGGVGGQAISGQNLTTMMGDIRQGAVESLTPVQDYTNAVINLLSTVENIPQDQITPIATTIAQAAKLAQINVEDATKAFTTMNVAFGKPTNLANIQRTAQEFFLLTKLAPGGPAAGGQIIGQMGQLAQVTRAAGGTQEDLMSLLLTGLRSGIPPSQLGRGLQFMVQTLGFPG